MQIQKEMTIKQYKKKFEELFNQLCKEHGDCKYVSIEKSQTGIGFHEQTSVNVEIVL